MKGQPPLFSSSPPSKGASAHGPVRHLVLIDGSGFVYRAFHALPRLTTRTGLPTHAVYGFVQMLHKVLKEFAPDAIAVVLDAPGPTFRHALFQDYKKSRPPMPPDLQVQWPYIRKVCEALGIPILEMEGFEADDLIASLARQAAEEGWRVTIVTSDKDMLQLVGDRIEVFHPQRDKVYTPAEVQQEYGLAPDQIPDYLALVGDPIDDVPGVKGIGEKSARELIRQFGSLEALYKNLDRVPARYRSRLEQGLPMAQLSKQLVELARTAPVSVDWSKLRRRNPQMTTVVGLLRELEFFSLMTEFLQDIHDRQPRYRLVDAETLAREWPAWVRDIRARGRVAFGYLWDGPHPARGEWRALAMAWAPHEAVVFDLTDPAVRDRLRHCLPDVLRAEGLRKVAHGWKDLMIGLRRLGLSVVPPWDDPMLMSYVLDPSGSRHDLYRLAQAWLLYRMIDPDVVRQVASDWPTVTPETRTDVVGEMADMTLQVTQALGEELEKSVHDGPRSVYETIEMPLVPVLADMEWWGIKVDVSRLRRLAHQISQTVHELQERIFQIVGFRFNLNSQKQLARVLFEELGLQPSRRTPKTRHYSTRADVLEELASHHEVPRLILTYRNLAKLKSTFVDALLTWADPRTHRVHTRFHQAVTSTGRLSSSDPNLQNIPVRDDLGKEIRSSFIAEDGWHLLIADYSQIELRILAHMSGDEGLIEAFRRGEDIHTRTAAEVLGLAPDRVTERERRLAKVINYGIVYGLSAYGLAQQTGMSPEEAQEFIQRYFERYPAVRAFLDRILEEGRRRGYVETLLGRRCYIPELTSPDPQVRQAAERQAVNMPIQGTAADLMKLAMVRVWEAFRQADRRSRLLLQVHDELVVEVPDDERAAVVETVRSRMETVYPLQVPLAVRITVRRDWAKETGMTGDESRVTSKE